jgi:hypothetical protein
MKVAKNRPGCDGSEGSTVRCNSAFVGGGELNEDTAQVCLPKHGQVVDAVRFPMPCTGPASLPTRMGPTASSRGNRFALLRSLTKPGGDRPSRGSPLAVFRMYVVDDHPGDGGGNDDE